MGTIARVALILLLAGSACDPAEPLAAPQVPDRPALDRFALAPEPPPPGDFVHPITPANANPYFPLVPGTTWTYESETEDGLERTVDTVLEETYWVDALGVTATVVLDRVYAEDEDSGEMELVELTRDWYGQDLSGIVWYLGEESCEYEPGEYEGELSCGPAGDPAGSWEAGKDVLGLGTIAEAGVIMWAVPIAYRGKAYRQEYYEDEAEDMARVLRDGLDVELDAFSFPDCVETMDWTPLEPGEIEHKFYCPGVGMALEVQPAGGRVRNELVALYRPGVD